MRHGKSLLAAIIVVSGLASSASAQGFAVSGFAGDALGNGIAYNNFGYNNFGYNSGYGGINNFGLYNGGYNTGPWFYPGTYTARTYPQTGNNMFGLMNSIQTQTGAGNSYRYGYGPAVGGRRR